MLLATAMALALVTAGCGGGSDSSQDSATQSGSTTSPEGGNAGSGQPPASEGSGLEPSREFVGSGPNGQLATIGEESGPAEREDASRVLEKFFMAGQAGDWEAQCELLAASARESVESPSLGSVGCPRALEAQARRAPASVRANTMTGPIDAFRINEDINGFAFYHGTAGKDFVIPLIEQGGEWKVVALTPEEISS
jgi:hypothetical protein